MRAARSWRAGYTLVELVIGGLFLASLLLVAGLATERTLAVYRSRRAEQEVVVTGNRLLERLARELSFAVRAGLGPPTLVATGSERVEYHVAEGGGALSRRRAFALELDPAELDNDRDDDGDGLVDEQEVLWIEDEGGPDERREVLATGVAEYASGEQANGLDDDGNGLIDERGLSFVRDGDALVVRVTLLFVLPGGFVREHRLETTVLPRN